MFGIKEGSQRGEIYTMRSLLSVSPHKTRLVRRSPVCSWIMFCVVTVCQVDCRGDNLLSSLIIYVCHLPGMHKINSTSYHPQGDGLVENFNHTLQAMMTKHAKEFGPACNLHLQ